MTVRRRTDALVSSSEHDVALARPGINPPPRVPPERVPGPNLGATRAYGSSDVRMRPSPRDVPTPVLGGTSQPASLRQRQNQWRDRGRALVSARWDGTPLWQHGLAAALIGPVVWQALGPAATGRFGTAMAMGAGAQAVFVAQMRRRLGAAVLAPADAVTLVRATVGSALFALIAGGEHDRTGSCGKIAFGLLVGAVATDLIDGLLARRNGPTRLGAVLDIEADSLLTLATAAAATAWGDLPRAALLPPALRYRDPILAFRRGEEPSGGGPWWCRASGAMQMAVFLAALRPRPYGSGRRLRPAALAVIVAQLTTQALDGRRRNPHCPDLPSGRGARQRRVVGSSRVCSGDGDQRMVRTGLRSNEWCMASASGSALGCWRSPSTR